MWLQEVDTSSAWRLKDDNTCPLLLIWLGSEIITEFLLVQWFCLHSWKEGLCVGMFSREIDPLFIYLFLNFCLLILESRKVCVYVCVCVWERERERETSTYSTYLYIHWLILLIRDWNWTHSLGISGWCSNQLSYLVRTKQYRHTELTHMIVEAEKSRQKRADGTVHWKAEGLRTGRIIA